jgi:hypothetical protein
MVVKGTDPRIRIRIRIRNIGRNEATVPTVLIDFLRQLPVDKGTIDGLF